MDERPVFRCHYRAQVREDAGELGEAISACKAQAEALIAEGRLMTAALYYYGRQLFLYYEALGEELPPERFMGPLEGMLSLWPQKEKTCRWVLMYPIYWHQEPKNAEDWKRNPPRARRRGRIAYLKHDVMFEYVYHHFAIVREGLLKGDRYMSIALHEDVLFSYFEEPRSSDNIRRTEGESEAIRAWAASDPDSHFIHLPGSESQNFLLLPAYFDVGTENP